MHTLPILILTLILTIILTITIAITITQMEMWVAHINIQQQQQIQWIIK